jgi:hypothetical protein
MPSYTQDAMSSESATATRPAAKLSRSPKVQRFAVRSIYHFRVARTHKVIISPYQALDINMAAGSCTVFIEPNEQLPRCHVDDTVGFHILKVASGFPGVCMGFV